MSKINHLLKSIMVLVALLGSSVLLYKATASAYKLKSDPPLRLARLSDSASVHSNTRPTPSINLSDGHDLLTDYAGPDRARAVLQDNLGRPAALSSADFDEDGVPDLICAYGTAGGGIITLHRGNPDAIYPDSAQAQRRKAEGQFTDAPFLSAASVFESEQEPDFVVAGDFDANGHQDIVVASRGSNVLFLLPGDGRAGFGAAKRIELPGTVTALATGEMNRADGLGDIAVGILAADGPKALVYEGLEGAARATPRVFDLPSEATALALGKLDDDYMMDLAVAAGRDVLVHYGQVNNAKHARSSNREFGSAVRSITIGNFIDKDRPSLAVLTDDGAVHLLGQSDTKKRNQKKSARLDQWKEQSLAVGGAHPTELVRARVSCAQTDSLVAIDSATHQMQIIADDPYAQKQDSLSSASASRKIAAFDVEGAPVAALPIRLNRSALDNLVILRSGQTSPSVLTPQVMVTFTVTTSVDMTGVQSFRDAIMGGNANPRLDNIVFDVGSGPITINLNSPLPNITDPVVINGTTQPGFAGNPIVEIDGLNVPLDGLVISASNSTVSGLVINRFGGSGIRLISGNNQVILNFIGTDLSGTVAAGNKQAGVRASGPNNTIGNPDAGNVISANGSSGVNPDGILLESAGNVVQGNLIGTDVTGSIDMGNRFSGVDIQFGSGNTIGGVTPSARNVISGNDSNGVFLATDAQANLVQGNLIGTNATGTAALANTFQGIDINSADNTIGGTAAGAGNVLSGNGAEGVRMLDSAATGNRVQGNFIGTDSSGAVQIHNTLAGVFITGASGNTIGGAVAGARNVLSGNADRGVTITADGNFVQGNFIGTDSSGTSVLGNKLGGILIVGSNNVVGGTAPGAGNVISGNDVDGLQVAGVGSSNNLIQGNFIGTDVSGTAGVGNQRVGVLISNAATNNTVGGTSDAARNVISSNGDFGIQIAGGGTSNNVVQGNFIGTAASGSLALGNSDGVHISLGASGNSVGGPASSAGNVIAFNRLNGVAVEAGIGNSILSNSIFSNALLGIDLGSDGATPNDPGDADAGANNLQNFPQLTSAVVSLASTIIEGTLNSTPNTTFTLQFFSNAGCDDSGFGEGRQLAGTRTIQTDPDGNAIISFSFPGNFSLPITATATDPSGNTSEFSPCAFTASGSDLAINKTASAGVVKSGDTLTYTITVINKGSAIADDVTLVDSLPNSVTFVSCSTTGNGLCLGSGNDRRVVFGALPSGASATITFVTTVNAPLPNGTLIVNTATISSSGPEANPADNVSTATVIVSDAPPAIVCPGNIVGNVNPGQCVAIVQYPPPTLGGPLIGSAVICLPPSGSTFPAGVTTVKCSARSQTGEIDNCSFTITLNSPASARVTLPGGAAALNFGPAEARRKTRKPPKGCACDSTFTIENTGCAVLNLTLDSILRTGSDVTSGRIANPDDSKAFSVRLINNSQFETDLAIGGIVTIQSGQTRSFRVLFNPGFPSVTGKTSGLAAADLLPDLITSKITFKQSGIETALVNLVARIATDVHIIDPADARKTNRVVFTKSGNEFTVTFGVFDADLDVNRATFEFLDGNGQLVEQAFDVDLTQAIGQNNIIKGQSFVVTQKFTGAASHAEVASVRLKVSDPHSSDSVTAQLAANAAFVQSLQDSARRVIVLPLRRLDVLP